MCWPDGLHGGGEGFPIIVALIIFALGAAVFAALFGIWPHGPFG